MPRVKGRDNFALRRVDVDLGPINQADGSARFTLGLTSVLVAVQGPRPAKVSRERWDKATVDVVLHQRAGIPIGGGDSKALNDYKLQQRQGEEDHLVAFLRETMEAVVLSSVHPNTFIQFVVQVCYCIGHMASRQLDGLLYKLARTKQKI